MLGRLAAAALAASGLLGLTVVPFTPPQAPYEVVAGRSGVDLERGRAVVEVGVLRLTPRLHYSFEDDPDRRRLVSVALRIEPGPRYRRFRPAEGPRWTLWRGERVEQERAPEPTAVRIEAIEVAHGDRRLLLEEVGVSTAVDTHVEVPLGVDVPDWTRLRVLVHLRFLDETAVLLKGVDDGDPRRTFAWEVSFNRTEFGPHRPTAGFRRPLWAVREAFLDPVEAPAGGPADLVVVVGNEGDVPAETSVVRVRLEGRDVAAETIPPVGRGRTIEARLRLAAPPPGEALEIATATGTYPWRRPLRPRFEIVSVRPRGVPREGETTPIEIVVAEEAGLPVGDLVAVVAEGGAGPSGGTRIEVPVGPFQETGLVRLDWPPRPAGRRLLEVSLVRGRRIERTRRVPLEVLPPPRPRPRVRLAEVRVGGLVEVEGVVGNDGDGVGSFEIVGLAAGEEVPFASVRLEPGETEAVSFVAPRIPGGWEAGLGARVATETPPRLAADRRPIYLPRPPAAPPDEGETVVAPSAFDGRRTRGVVWRAAGETLAVGLVYDLSAFPPGEVGETVVWTGRALATTGPAAVAGRAGAEEVSIVVAPSADDRVETDVRLVLPFAERVEVTLAAPASALRALGPPAPRLAVVYRDLDLAAVRDVEWLAGVGRVAVEARVEGRSILRPRRSVRVVLEADGEPVAEAEARPGARLRLEAAVPPGLRAVRLAVARPEAGAAETEARALLYVPGPGRPRLSFAAPPVRDPAAPARASAVVAVDDAPAYDVEAVLGERSVRFSAAAGESIVVVGPAGGAWGLRHPAEGEIGRPRPPAPAGASWRLLALEARPGRLRWALDNLGGETAVPSPAVVGRIDASPTGDAVVARVVADVAGGPAVPPAGVVWHGAVLPPSDGPVRALVRLAGGALAEADVPAGPDHPAGPAAPFRRPIVAAPSSDGPTAVAGWAAVAREVALAAEAVPSLAALERAARDLATTVDDATPRGRLAARAAADRLGAAADRLAAAAASLPWPVTAEAEDVATLAEAAAALASAVRPPVLDRPVVLAFAERLAAALRPLRFAPRPSTAAEGDASVPPR